MTRVLLILLLLGGCDAASNELPPVEQARSVGAEWAGINQLEAQGRVTHTYAAMMRRDARSELETLAGKFADPRSPEARLVEQLLALPDHAPPAELRQRSEQLKAIEDRLVVS